MNHMMKNNPMIMILLILIIIMAVGGFRSFFSGDHIDSYEGEERTGPWHMMGTGGMWTFPFFPIIIIAVILYFVFGRTHRCWSGPGSGNSALEILKKRYAEGEITKDEFEEMKKDLLS